MKFNRRLAKQLHRRTTKSFGSSAPALDAWAFQIGAMARSMTLHPGGRATIRDWTEAHHGPGSAKDESPSDLELRWQRAQDGLPYITSISLVAPPGEVLDPEKDHSIRVGWLWAALVTRLAVESEPPPEDAPRPETGRPPVLDHYRKVLAEYDALVRERHPSPVAALAERYGARPGTVKAWLHRGRKYLKAT